MTYLTIAKLSFRPSTNLTGANLSSQKHIYCQKYCRMIHPSFCTWNLLLQRKVLTDCSSQRVIPLLWLIPASTTSRAARYSRAYFIFLSRISSDSCLCLRPSTRPQEVIRSHLILHTRQCLGWNFSKNMHLSILILSICLPTNLFFHLKVVPKLLCHSCSTVQAPP